MPTSRAVPHRRGEGGLVFRPPWHGRPEAAAAFVYSVRHRLGAQEEALPTGTVVPAVGCGPGICLSRAEDPRMSACCGPERDSSGAAPRMPSIAVAASPPEVTRKMVAIPGGDYWLGGDAVDAFPEDGEGPVRRVRVSDFHIDARAVTSREFAAFVKATGYATEAEQIGWSYVFYSLLAPQARPFVIEGTVAEAPWWLAVRGASWRSPHGPESGWSPNHPVVHTSWNDAQAYATWASKRLPTEAEWEVAARGALEGARYPWGDELTPRGQHRCNIWQGTFPRTNTLEDGHLGTAPANAYRPNGYGLYNMAGNVWEWCADWWSSSWHAKDSPENRVDPTGPPTGRSRVIRGGSYLCHASYCNRYRVAARTHNTPDSSTGHMGFRCAATPA